MQPHTQVSPCAPPMQALLNTLSRAINKLERRLEIRSDLTEAILLLETLPLSMEEFGRARNRLWNAGRYLRSAEFCAARWELRTLRNFFVHQENDVAPRSPNQKKWSAPHQTDMLDATCGAG